MLTLRERLRGIADVSRAALRRAAVVNFMSVGLLLAATLWIQRTTALASTASQLTLLAETQRGLVSRVVAEMDLSRQVAIQKRFVEISDLLSEGASANRLDMQGDLVAARKAGDEVFAFASAFAQQQALSVNDGPFADATSMIQAKTRQHGEAANAAVFRAMVALWGLGIGALILQRIANGRAERRLTHLMDQLADGITSGIEDSANAAERIARGDLRALSTAPTFDTREANRLHTALSGMEARLRLVLSDVQAASETLAAGAQQVSASAHASRTAPRVRPRRWNRQPPTFSK